MNKRIVSKSLSLLVLPLLIGCGGTSGTVNHTDSESSTDSVKKIGVGGGV